MKKTRYVYAMFMAFALVLVVANGCSVSYSFNGASIDYSKTKTIQINDFPIRSSSRCWLR